MGLPLMTVEAVPVLEGLVADGAVDGALHAVHRLEVAPVHATNYLKSHRKNYLKFGSPSISTMQITMF